MFFKIRDSISNKEQFSKIKSGVIDNYYTFANRLKIRHGNISKTRWKT
jgi:hypothetical protein